MGEVRGRIMNPEKRLQLVTYENVRYGKITPTDIDGVIDFGGHAFVLYEIKCYGTPLKPGQKFCLENMVNAFAKGGCKATAIFAYHTVFDTRQVIDAADCIVQKLYFDGRWYTPPNATTLKQKTDDFKRFVDGYMELTGQTEKVKKWS